MVESLYASVSHSASVKNTPETKTRKLRKQSFQCQTLSFYTHLSVVWLSLNFLCGDYNTRRSHVCRCNMCMAEANIPDVVPSKPALKKISRCSENMKDHVKGLCHLLTGKCSQK